MSTLLESVKENAMFVAEVIGIVVLLFVAAVLVELLAQKVHGRKEKILSTREITVVGMFSALAAVLMLFEFPLPFAPGFYGLDFSELPILIGSFAFGPTAGVLMEFVKIFLKVCMKPTSTAFVGELANFAVGCSFILPASIIYTFWKKKKGAIVACVLGTLVLTIFGTAFNAIYLIPAFSNLFGLPMEQILAMGSEVNPLMTEGSLVSFVICCVAPLNLIKGSVSSIFTILVYKRLSPIIKGNRT